MILMGYFNAQLGKEAVNRKTIGNFPAHKRPNQNGKRIVELYQLFDLKLMSTQFRKKLFKKETWRSPTTFFQYLASGILE